MNAFLTFCPDELYGMDNIFLYMSKLGYPFFLSCNILFGESLILFLVSSLSVEAEAEATLYKFYIIVEKGHFRRKKEVILFWFI